MSNKSGTSEQVISLPKGGGAMHGMGETFSPDLHTGTGNFTVPIALPPGRNGFQPQLNLVYSTGNGNSPFGLGWSLSIPGVSRKTSQGVPQYHDHSRSEKPDVFILSGAEDLVPVGDPVPGVTRYRPRTEGLFARIEHHHSGTDDYWEVRSKDGLVSTYGQDPADTPPYAAEWPQPDVSALVAGPGAPTRVFAWKLTATRDPYGNRIEYLYRRSKTDPRDERNGHSSDQPLLRQIRYADFTDANDKLRFLVAVSFEYEDRPDRFSDYRAGFEIRTAERCKAIRIETHFDQPRAVREYRFTYDDRSALNGVSLLERIEVVGYDDDGNAYDGSDPKYAHQLPPLTFGYTAFEPKQRTFEPVVGVQPPAPSLASPSLELADLTGDGLPDILEMNGTVRTWRNLGNGRFDMPRFMRNAPPVKLADPGVQMLDADGDGRIDLMVTDGILTQVYPLNFDGEWDKPASKPSAAVPSFNLEDPEVKLVDIDGDGVTDAIRSGTRLECFRFDRHQGWQRPRPVERKALDEFPNVNFSDPRVKWGDMTGDGLQDIVLVHDGAVDYWPNLGHGNWGRRVHMQGSPSFREPGYTLGYDPKRVLIGDVDGDGLADIVYVGNHKVTLWINHSGDGWSAPTEIRGTPGVTDMDSVRLVDLLGNGIGGVLWSADANGNGRPQMFFLDLTGGVKPYLLHEMDNHLGATTKVEYQPSTRFYLEDRARRQPWRTSLPFPVQAVARVEVIDHLSQGKLTTEYRYHHGYWDGAEREFRGFGMVEQLDTETFDRYNADGLHGKTGFDRVDDDPASGRARKQFFSQPTLTRTWFHQGPIGPEFGEWQADLDLSDTFWRDDRRLLDPWEQVNQFLQIELAGKTPDQRRTRRDALRTLRGSILRTELYALDGSAREGRPYTVTESQYALAEFDPPDAAQPGRKRIFFPHLVAQRTTQWERGDDPLTQFAFTSYVDPDRGPVAKAEIDIYGRPHTQTQIACPRGWRTLADTPAAGYLASRTRTDYAERDDGNRYMVDRVKRTTTLELKQADTHGKTLVELRNLPDGDSIFQCIGQMVSYYDSLEADLVKDYGRLGDYGVATRTETLAFTEIILDGAYGAQRPPYLKPTPGAITWPAAYPSDFQQRIDGLPDHVGYVFRDGVAATQYEAGYYVAARRHYDFQDNPATGRGLVVVQYDPLGHGTAIAYDHQLLPKTVTDAAGLETTADYNYRVLQPSLVADPNGNRTAVRYSPIGLPLSIALVGKQDSPEGDRRREEDKAVSTPPVDYPSQCFEYGLRAYFDTEAQLPEKRRPVYVRALKRQEHFGDIVAAANAARHAAGLPDLTDAEIDNLFPDDEFVKYPERFIEAREYSDGFGRLLQTRTQGEEERFGDPALGDGVVPADQADTAGTSALVQGRENRSTSTPNVIVSGRQTYDNKGRVVEKYEPYFDAGWDYHPRTSTQGVKATMFYDPQGQVVRTLNPDGSEQRVIYGVPQSLDRPDLFDPTPWEAYTYDANDLAPLSSAPDGASLAARAPAAHHFTPSSIEIDALGRTVRAVQRLSKTEEIVTCSEYDLPGNVVKIVDALGRDAFLHVFDLAKRRLWLKSIDAGERWTVYDAAGNVIEGRDNKDAVVLRAYDPLNRPTTLWARNNPNRTVTLRERLAYGDGSDPGQPAAERQTNRRLNRLGKPASHDDEAGTLTFERYDFKGNLLQKVRQVVADSALTAGQVFEMDWDHPPALDPVEYVSEATFDALNRPRSGTETLRAGGTVTVSKTVQPRYNRAGALESVALDGATYVERIAYNPKGQRTLITYGNGVMTRYAYDPQTFRLARLRTEGYTAASLQYLPGGAVRQDFAYEYDLAGNITAIHDRTPGCGLPAKPNQLDRQFTYDAIYRLSSADGRECDTLPPPPSSPPTPPWDDTFRCDDVTKTRTYQQSYTYDVAGNILKLQHTAGGGTGSFTRDFAVRSQDNRLDHVTVGSTDYKYDYDDNGNMTQETLSRRFEWDHSDHLIRFTVQATAGGPASIEAQYLYDAGGQRVKKWVRNQGGDLDATVYIDGLFEHQRWQRPGASGENTHLHVMDDQSRVAIVRDGSPHPDDKGEKVQYHLGDHLGSSGVVIGGADEKANNFINREEFYPYGETSFGSFAKKRYRFTGKERDEESGLNYHEARYYAPWLARWVSCDPAVTTVGDGQFPQTEWEMSSAGCYVYAANPVILTDQTGRKPKVVVRVGTKILAPAVPKVEVEKSKGEPPKFKWSVEIGPVTAKGEKRQVKEVGVKYGPAILKSDEGNPKVGLEVGAKVGAGDVEVEAKAKVEATFRVLENQDPYSPGSVEVSSEVKVKGGPVEVGVKDKLLEKNLKLGPGGETSDDIRLARERQGEAMGTSAHDNIKVRLQQDPPPKPRTDEEKQVTREVAPRSFWNILKYLGTPFEIDPKTGEIVHEQADPIRYRELASRKNPAVN